MENSSLIPQWIISIESNSDIGEIIAAESERIGQFLTVYARTYHLVPPTAYIWICMRTETPLNHTELQEIKKRLLHRMKQELLQKTKYPPKEIRLFIVPVISFTLENLTSAFAPHVHRVSVVHPMDRLGQVVGTGDPLAARAFFMEGMRQWEERYASIYLENNTLTVVNTSNTLTGKDWITVFRQFIRSGDYRAALLSLREHIKTHESLSGTRELVLVRHALEMLIDRFNFAFGGASVHLRPLETFLPNHPLIEKTKSMLDRLQRKEGDHVGDLERIVELYRHMDLFLDMDDLHSFFIRFYRARESILEYIYRYGGDHPRELPASIHIIHQLIDQIEEDYAEGEIHRFVGAYFYTKSKNVSDTLKLRNDSIVGHGRVGFKNQEIWRQYNGYAGNPIYKSKSRFERDTALLLRELGTEMDEHFAEWNELILQLVTEGVRGYVQEVAVSNYASCRD